ncbi:aquaporin [Kitasatospora sp. LaBMicrA B282]|uniref:aquaporin n=1 Tax=Kitasatospora sp. LaBMicrA B282 TaxID=3420949 RepID=UPI003D0D0761
MDRRALLCEFAGTLMLVLFAVGAAVVAGPAIGTVGIALAFGCVLLALAYAMGPISGCHVNPAVTLGFLVARRIDGRTALGYWAAQLLGGLAGAALVFLLAAQIPGLPTHGKLGSNGWGSRSTVHTTLAGAFLTEVLLTLLLVYVVLAVTHRLAATGFAGLPIGLALTAVHLVGIPLTGTSVNPARSLGPALFAGGAALSQVWLFLLALMIGGALAAGLHLLTHPRPATHPTSTQAAAGTLSPQA